MMGSQIYATSVGGNTVYLPLCWLLLFVFLDLVLSDKYTRFRGPSFPEEKIVTQYLRSYGLLFIVQFVNFAFAVSSDRFTGTQWCVLVVLQVFVAGTALGCSHELAHGTKTDRFICWWVYTIHMLSQHVHQHLYLHHPYVCTSKDTESAYENEDLYHYLARVLFMEMKWYWDNVSKSIFIASKFVTLGIWYLIYFFAGVAALKCVVGVVVATLLFTYASFYPLHYGLMRREISPGRFELTAKIHSWSTYFPSNYLAFQLPVHADHHTNAKRFYYNLRENEDSPEYPWSQSTQLVIAMFPPLWRKMVHPILHAHMKKHNMQSTVPL